MGASSRTESLKGKLDQAIETVNSSLNIGKALAATTLTTLILVGTGPFSLTGWGIARAILWLRFDGTGTGNQGLVEQLLRTSVCLLEWGPRSLIPSWIAVINRK
jgi:hypothetical protein